MPRRPPPTFAAGLAALRGKAELARLKRGIEKESLRVQPTGHLARTPHPPALGSPLTHPHITTDFSEAQLELITGTHTSVSDTLAELEAIHRWVAVNIGDELLWSASMPCRLGKESQIPIARFGAANVALSKTIYRTGLAYRYGRLMQTISGIHYNFSLPDALWPALAKSRGQAPGRDFVTGVYFDLIRNFRRYSWLLVYLFGASPAICRSFIPQGGDTALERLDADTLFLPHATSLRMGPLGYQSATQAALHISYNSLEDYAVSMRAALTEPHPPYAIIGAKVGREYRQLSTTLLQIENEFYGAIRPKRRVRSGERPLDALHDRGVEYVEVRCQDLDPFLPLGIDAVACRFLDVFLLVCLLRESPPDDRRESERLGANQLAVVERGRSPTVALAHGDRAIGLREWADNLLADCRHVAEVLDAVGGDASHGDAVECQARKLADPAQTPSARVLAALRQHGVSFADFALGHSKAHRQWFEAPPLASEERARFAAMSADSRARQAAVEAADRDRGEPFDDYLERYLKLRH